MVKSSASKTLPKGLCIFKLADLILSLASLFYSCKL
jgi:hypothetical protein